MRLVDTSIWVEWLIDSSLGKTIMGELPAHEQWLVPTIVQLELAKWLTRNVGEDRADQVIAFIETCNVADLDTAIALSAADLCARHKLATADAIVYATARAHGADLFTCDRRNGRKFCPRDLDFCGLSAVRFRYETDPGQSLEMAGRPLLVDVFCRLGAHALPPSGDGWRIVGPRGVTIAVLVARRGDRCVWLTPCSVIGDVQRSTNAQARNRGLRQFLVRGVCKAKSIALLHGLTHNMVCGWRLIAA